MVAVAASFAMAPHAASSDRVARAPTTEWEKWLHVPGILDVIGHRSYGRLVAAARGSWLS
jgi:hypothetical protein